MQAASELIRPRPPPPEPSRLHLEMYEAPPLFDYSLSALVLAAQERLHCLQEIENLYESRKHEPEHDNFYQRIGGIVARYDFWRGQRDDEASHWMLKLTFLNDEVDETESFFRFAERLLFSGRLYLQAEQNVRSAAAANEPTAINDAFFDFLADYAGQRPLGPDRAVQVPFRFAGGLFEKYELELHNGFALVPPASAFRMLQDLFAELLFRQHRQLREVARAIRQRDPRLVEIATALRRHKKERVHYEETRVDANPRTLPVLARTHFPLCMEEIYEALRRKHALKHWGRLQLGLFLKGIGLSLENNTDLFLNELKQTVAGAKKISEYRYYLEHIYGRKGKKVEYSPWGCQKMSTKAAPAAGDVFGCPFQYYSDDALRRTLGRKGLGDEDVEDVLGARSITYAQGCRQYFLKMHPGVPLREGIGRHPNGYFAASFYSARRGSDRRAVAAEPAEP